MNVSRVYRLLKLITMLRSGRSQDVSALADAIGVSRRTLFRDLKLLELAGVPYHFDYDRQTYEIPDSFFLPALHLEFPEALALLLVTRKFLSRQVHPLYQHALTAALKIESSLPPAIVEDCGHYLDRVSIRWPPVSSADATGDVFRTIQQALVDRRRIKVRYDSVYDRQEITDVLEPLRLVFVSRGWYLLARSLTHHQVRTYKIDRMIEVAVTEQQFQPDPGFSERAHFGAAWCMIPEGRIYPIKLRFSRDVAASVEEVRWHPSQATTRLDDGRLLFEAKVDGLREISAWVLSYGDQVEVLAPKELRHQVRQKAEGAVALAKTLEAQEAR